MDKQNPLYNKSVYIAIPKRLYNDAICERAIAYIKTLNPFCIVDPRCMFASNEEWKANFPLYLDPLNICVVVTDTGFIGKGVYEEVCFFNARKQSCYQYVERSEYRGILRINDLRVVNWNNWTDFAMIKYDH